MSCKLALNIKEEFKNNNYIDSDNNIINPRLLDKAIKNIEDLSFYKYGFKLPENTFKITNITPFKSKIEINDDNINVLSEDITISRDIEDLNTTIKNGIYYNNLNLDNTLKERLFNNKDNIDMKSLLNTIKDSDHVLAPLADKLLTLIKDDNLNVELVDELPNLQNLSLNGMYYGEKISINKNGLFKNGKAESVIIHEVLHHLTSSELELNNKETRDLKKLYEYAKQNLDNNLYPLKDIDEFLVALYTNSNFITKLKSIKPLEGAKDYRNLFEQILDLISKLLNLSNEKSLFEQAFNTSTYIVKKGAASNQRKYEGYLDFINNNPNYKDNDEGFAMYSMALLSNRGDAKYSMPEKETTEETVEETKSERQKRIFEEKETTLITADDKLSNQLEISLRSLKERIDSLLRSSNMNENKNPNKSKYLKVRAETLQRVFDDLEKYQETNKVTGALIFAEEADNNLKYINNQLQKLDMTDMNDLEFVLTFYESYIKSFASLPKMKKILNNYKNFSDNSLKEVDSKKVDEALLVLNKVTTKYAEATENFQDFQKKFISKKLNDIKYFPIIETQHKERLALEHKANNIKEDKETWILKQMSGRDNDLIQKDILVRIAKVLDNPASDTSMSDRLLGNATKTKTELVQLFEFKLNEMHDKIISKDMADDQKIKKLFDKLSKEKNTTNHKKLYENIIEYDSKGMPFLKSDYKLEVLEASSRMTTIRYKMKELVESTEEYKKLEKEYLKLEKKYFKKNSETNEILDKYKNSYSNLSSTEKEILDFFKELNDRGNKLAFGRANLNKYIYKNKDAVFYGLPKIYKSGLERILGKENPLREVKEGFVDLKNLRTDDIGYINAEYDASGKEIFKIPLHFREGQGKAKMKVKDQSTDLFTIYRLENKNLNRFEVKKELELEMSTFIDVASYRPMYVKSGSNFKQNTKSGKFEKVENSMNSNMHKMLQHLFEQQFYDVLNKNDVKFLGLSANKLTDKITGLASWLSLTFNLGQGVANITNTKTQLLLESFIKGDIIKGENIKNAELFYSKHLKETMADVTRPINKSIINQINEYFDLEGNMMGEAGDFLQTTLAKKGLSKEAQQVFQTSGEHWIQSTIILSVLDGIKVRDKDYNYINKKGNIVATEKEAASMLDMFSQDENKALVVSDKFKFTNFNKLTEFEKGGKTKIKMLISNKIYDIVGNYKQKTRAEVYRHWYGKLFGMFRKYFYDMFNRRFKGITSSNKHKSQLREDQLHYNSSLQSYEEGIYTSLIRFVSVAIQSRENSLTLLKGHWNSLTSHEKANITQSVGEFALTLVIIPMLSALLYAAFDDDDDDAIVGFVLYQMRRLESELAQFYSIPELYKILRSPIPASRLLNDFISTFGELFEVGNSFNGEALVDPDFEKFFENVKKRTPFVREFMKDYNQYYQFQDRSVFSF